MRAPACRPRALVPREHRTWAWNSRALSDLSLSGTNTRVGEPVLCLYYRNAVRYTHTQVKITCCDKHTPGRRGLIGETIRVSSCRLPSCETCAHPPPPRTNSCSPPPITHPRRSADEIIVFYHSSFPPPFPCRCRIHPLCECTVPLFLVLSFESHDVLTGTVRRDTYGFSFLLVLLQSCSSQPLIVDCKSSADAQMYFFEFLPEREPKQIDNYCL